MTIAATDLDRLAILARIALSADQRLTLLPELERVLAMVATLNQIDVDGVLPLAHPHDLELRLRPDQVACGDQQAALAAIAPQMQGGLYLVPKVIE
ncbi:MAG: Asp-tRNA(Asn)/Glu-tRNA(Gln) amidotransferase subunit GatC [Lysobacterales bacterium]